MKLVIDFPSDTRTDMLLENERIPCFCIVSKDFEIRFEHVVSSNVSGIVQDWSHSEIDLRSPAMAGGEHSHYCHGLISLSRTHENVYKIRELHFFESPGWCAIVLNGEYGPIGKFWD